MMARGRRKETFAASLTPSKFSVRSDLITACALDSQSDNIIPINICVIENIFCVFMFWECIYC